jgi:cyclohexyl-isocyanide hydratase
MPVPLHIGFPLFSNLTQLDLTAPWEILTRIPDAQCHLLAHNLDAVRSASGLKILPTKTYQDCPQLDVICVPGGPGHLQAMEDTVLLDFLRRQAVGAQFISSVCTGTLVLAAAGLLQGYRATTHWMSLDRLALFGALPENRRVVIDRNRVTGGGVTAGIDFGLTLLARLCGEQFAREIQLQIEYIPEPPFAEAPQKLASQSLIESLRAKAKPLLGLISKIDERAAARLYTEKDG